MEHQFSSEENEWMIKNNISTFPSSCCARLSRLGRHSPETIYFSGHPDVKNPAAGIVGTRKSDCYGREIAFELARILAGMNITIITGGAEGIDTSALLGCFESSGRAQVILGGGHARIFPAENAGLFRKISESGGGILSEFSPFTAPYPSQFLRRNRIIAALSDVLVVIEAPVKSGAMGTAHWAFKMHIPVLTPPSDIWYERSAGNNILLKNGAMPLTDPADVLNLLEFSSTEIHQNRKNLQRNSMWGKKQGSRPFFIPPEWKKLQNTDKKGNITSIVLNAEEACGIYTFSDGEQKLLEFFKDTPLHFDELINLSGMNVNSVSCSLLKLECEGFIQKLAGDYYMKLIQTDRAV
jgi:DNA protecting protein DprA